MNVKMKFLVLFLAAPILLSACTLESTHKINLTDAKMATAIDEKLMPVKVTDAFPEGTQKVFCWFQWKDTEVNMKITPRWYFVTDNIHILAYTFTIPRKEGSGSISLSMPEGKILPSGAYRIDFTIDKRILKSLTFKIG